MATRTRPRSINQSAITVICAWCDTVLVQGGEVVSHGLCEACADQMSRSIEMLPRSAVQPV